MTTTISGDTGVSQVQAGSINQDDLAANVVGKGPAFSAYPNVTTVCASGGDTKIFAQVEMFDLTGNYDPTTSRFTTSVAGYYDVKLTVNLVGAGVVIPVLYKNGVRFAYGGAGSSDRGSFSLLIYLGLSDYIEAAVYHNAGSNKNLGVGAENTLFQAALVRAA